MIDIVFPQEVESLLVELMGEEWRNSSDSEVNGILGTACVYAVLNGCSPKTSEVAKFLGVETTLISKPMKSLGMNGAFLPHRFESDRVSLEKKDPHTWSYYAAVASELVGTVGDKSE